MDARRSGPSEFIEAASNPTWLVAAHNDAFEAAIEQHILRPAIGWPLDPARAASLHHGDGAGGRIAGTTERCSGRARARNRKDAAGERLMHQTSKPRRARKDEDPDQVYWFDDQERLDRLYSYCRQDVEVERELYDRLPPLSPAEQRSGS